MNARRRCRAFKITRSGNTDERTMVWTWTHDGLDMNARWSGERTMVWTWTHESLDMNAQWSGFERTMVWTWPHDGLDMVALEIWRWTHEFELERTMVWTRTHESLDIYCFGLGWSEHICIRTHEERTKNFERTKIWTYPLSVWDGLDIGTLSLGRSGHRHFPSGPVWTYPLWVWDLSLGRHQCSC